MRFRNLAVWILLTGIAHAAHGRAIHVGPGREFSAIRAAVRSASEGDTVYIHSGVYHEGNIVIGKSLSVIGIGKPVIDGEHKSEVISVNADHVTISGLHIRRSGTAALNDPAGIRVLNSDHARILDNVLTDNFFGIYIQYGKHCEVRNNEITAFGKEEHAIGNGIHCWKSDSLLIIGNRIRGHRDGIYFEFVSRSLIWRNISEGNVRYGLHFMFSNDDHYISNIFRNNGAGVAVMFSKRVHMINNTFEENWGDAAYGLLLKEISDALVYNNRFSHNSTGVFMEGTNRIEFEKNAFTHNGWALRIQASCMDNSFTLGNFNGNTFDVATNGSLVLNTFDGNYWDRHDGYDLHRDGVSDVPYHPLSLFSVIAEKNSSAMLLYRSFMVSLLDQSEKFMPSLTPANFVDNRPRMSPVPL
jgi:nitrous oxidase accessory protein